MFSSLDMLRIFIGGEIKLTYTKVCRSTTEGSGWVGNDDDDILCEVENGGLGNLGSEKHFTSDDEDFTFVDETVDSENTQHYGLNQFGLDLKDFIVQFLRSSEQTYGHAQSLQQSLAGKSFM